MNDHRIEAPLEFDEGVTERQAQILSAALDVFAEKGYEGGSMREIASHVGVSEAALYRHFTGKEAIFQAMIIALGAAVRRDGIPKLRAVRAETIEADLHDLLLDRRRTVRRLEPALRVVVPVVIRNRAWVDEMRTRVAQPALEPIREKVAELDAAFGVVDADRTRDDRMRVVMSLVFGYLATSLLLEDEADDAIIDTVMSAMGWKRGTSSP